MVASLLRLPPILISRRALLGLMAALAAAGCLVCSATTQADEAPFYRGKTLSVQIGFSAGGYDLYGRTLARHIGRHLPGNPEVIALNMPGAGSIRLTNWLGSVAPRDGTHIGIIDRGLFLASVLDPATKIDLDSLSWIGSIASETLLCVSRRGAKVTRFEDLQNTEFVAGGLSKNDISYTSAALLSNMFRAKLRFVGGYPGGNDITLALERGEIDGRCAWSLSSVKSTRPQWLTDGSINLLVQYTAQRNPEIPTIPSLTEFAAADTARALIRFLYSPEAAARPIVAPKAIPAERLAVLQKAFMDTMKDPDFIHEATRAGLEVSPTPGAEVEKLVKSLGQTPKHIISAAQEYTK